MAIRQLRVSGDKRKYTHSALLAPRMSSDRCRIGTTWFTAADLTGQAPVAVDEVLHFGRHITAVGDTLVLKAFAGEELARVEATAIELTHKDFLSDSDLHALGMESLDDLHSGWAGTLSSGPIWLIRFVHLIGESK